MSILARKSEDFMCLKASGDALSKLGVSVAVLSLRAKRKKIETESHKVRTICGSSVRTFARVHLYGDPEKTVWLADCVTGSLYDPVTGKCASGDLEITQWHVET